jgi:hypothetical protein
MWGCQAPVCWSCFRQGGQPRRSAVKRTGKHMDKGLALDGALDGVPDVAMDTAQDTDTGADKPMGRQNILWWLHNSKEVM